jgi:hypothetical protein
MRENHGHESTVTNLRYTACVRKVFTVLAMSGQAELLTAAQETVFQENLRPDWILGQKLSLFFPRLGPASRLCAKGFLSTVMK